MSDITTEFRTVDAEDTAIGWRYDLVRRPEFSHRIFFLADTSFVNSMNAVDLIDWMETNVGKEGESWILAESENNMEDIWNSRSQDKNGERKARQHGNQLYLTAAAKFKCVNFLPKKFLDTITVIETRAS